MEKRANFDSLNILVKWIGCVVYHGLKKKRVNSGFIFRLLLVSNFIWKMNIAVSRICIEREYIVYVCAYMNMVVKSYTHDMREVCEFCIVVLPYA